MRVSQKKKRETRARINCRKRLIVRASTRRGKEHRDGEDFRDSWDRPLNFSSPTMSNFTSHVRAIPKVLSLFNACAFPRIGYGDQIKLNVRLGFFFR